MTQIQRIEVAISTATTSGAGTDGDVYLGLGGREFYIDTSDDDFEGGSFVQVTLGSLSSGPAATEPTLNDPRTLRPIAWAHLDLFPAYLRFEPRSSADQWKLNLAWIVVSAGDAAETAVETDYFTAGLDYVSQSSGIWLGPKCGLSLHLFRGRVFNPDEPRPLDMAAPAALPGRAAPIGEISKILAHAAARSRPVTKP